MTEGRTVIKNLVAVSDDHAGSWINVMFRELIIQMRDDCETADESGLTAAGSRSCEFN